MRQLWKDLLTAVFMGMVLPGLVVNAGALFLEKEEPAPQTEPVPVQSVRWNVLVRTGNAVEEMDMERYLVRAVLAEMPASFEPEALKAQSVAVRTYAGKASQTGGKHGDGSVCTDSACCQGYITEEDYLAKGGTQASVDKIGDAVEATSGCVLTYGEELIEATYFSCSGGTTEDAAAVWGMEYPYLSSVSSPEGEAAERYTQTIRFTPEEFQKALGRKLEGSPKNWFTICTYTEGGGVASMTIGGENYKGTQLRSLLGLRSTVFTVEASAAEISITTRGYGHRVGMSQYGADAMAVAGCTYREILDHYYPGTELVQLQIDETGKAVYP